MTFALSGVVDAPRERVFSLTQDYERRLLWDPFLREARLVDGATRAATGAKAWCVSKGGFGMETVYISFHPPGLAAVRMTRGPAALRSFAASWRFFDLGNGKTNVCFKYFLKLRGPFALLTPLVARIFEYDTKRRLEALQRYFELSTVSS